MLPPARNSNDEERNIVKFALNYSEPAAELIHAGKIQIDLFKTPPWEDVAAKATTLRPVYIHFAMQAGQGDNHKTGFDTIQHWVSKTQTPSVNTHIAPLLTDLNDPTNADEVIAKVVPDIQELVEWFGADKVIAENVPYPERTPSKPYLASDPQVISAIIQQTGCGLLLDIGHARRTAEYLALDPKRYISQLPVHRLREIHITGLGYHVEDGRRVDHLPMREDDWELLQWALDHIKAGNWSKPNIVACEYGGVGENLIWRCDPEVIAAQIPRMYAMVHAAQP
jgi:uncharacterized protein (UPF0276 family)